MLFFAIPGKIYIPMSVIYVVVGVVAAIALALFFKNKSAKAAAAKAVEAEQAAAPVAVADEAPAVSEGPVAPGSAGKLKLYDTPPKTAAMVMAIVADQLKKPINELRFISIKEVC